MQEIEVKAKLADPAALIAKLARLGIHFGDPVHQRDRIFAENLEKFVDFQPDVNFLRIREQEGTIFFTLKSSQKNENEGIEYETIISDAVELQHIIERLGFKEAVQVEKVRRKAKYNDIEICVDQIKNLGDFVELEKLTEGEDSEKVQQELFSILESWGINKTDEVTLGYDTMMRQKNLENNAK